MTSAGWLKLLNLDDGWKDAKERPLHIMGDIIADLSAEEERADMHAKINQAVSDALGQPAGASWNDLGAKVAAVKARAEAAEARCKRAIEFVEDCAASLSEDFAARAREWLKEVSR